MKCPNCGDEVDTDIFIACPNCKTKLFQHNNNYQPEISITDFNGNTISYGGNNNKVSDKPEKKPFKFNKKLLYVVIPVVAIFVVIIIYVQIASNQKAKNITVNHIQRQTNLNIYNAYNYLVNGGECASRTVDVIIENRNDNAVEVEITIEFSYNYFIVSTNNYNDNYSMETTVSIDAGETKTVECVLPISSVANWGWNFKVIECSWDVVI